MRDNINQGYTSYGKGLNNRYMVIEVNIKIVTVPFDRKSFMFFQETAVFVINVV